MDRESSEAFARVCRELSETEDYSARSAIGTYGEKRLHVAFKRYATTEGAHCEVKVGPYIADVCEKDRIVEIQTGGFYPLREKIAYYLERTTYHVTVMHPIAERRRRVWIDPATGEVTKVYASPRRGKPRDALRELFWLAPYLSHPRLCICLEMIEAEEIRLADGWSRDGRKGSHRVELIPRALCGEIVLDEAEDYRIFLPKGLTEPFTAAAFGKAMGLRGKAIYAALTVLTSVGLIEEAGKAGRAKLWRTCTV